MPVNTQDPLAEALGTTVAAQMRAHLAAIVENSHDAIISKTLDGIITSWNGAAERLFGYTAGEIVGQSILMLIPHDRRAEETEILHRLRAGERIESYETQRRARDGRLVDVSLTISPLRDERGRIIGASKIARDIGARKAVDKALRGSEQRYRSLVEASGAIVFHGDASASWLQPNPAWEAYTGQAFAEYRGHGWADAIHPEDRRRVMMTMAEAIAAGTVFEAEGRIWHAPSGTWRHQEARAVPICDPDGAVEAWVGTCLDVHARRQAEDALRAEDRRKDEFLAVMAHELRNPLAPLTNSVQILETTHPAEGTRTELMAIVSRQVRTLVRLVDDLLEASRIGRGQVELRRESLPLAAVVDAAIEQCRPLLESREHALEVSIEEGVRVDGDRMRLTQVVANLLHNAIKYTPRGGRIELSAARQGAFVELRLRDNGIGIPPDMLLQIFEMFRQVDTSQARAEGGLGIGLSIVRRLIELHGGSIRAISEGAGKGSTFIVQMPPGAPVASPRAPGPRPVAAPPRQRVLIADDNADAATSLSVLLQALGQEVHVVNNGPDAIEHAQRLAPDLLLLDIGMPGMNGYEAARRIRANPGGDAITIAAMTGWGQEEDRRRSREAGLDEHLVKPAPVEALVKLLERVSAKAARAPAAS